jgi:hypothetical protein
MRSKNLQPPLHLDRGSIFCYVSVMSPKAIMRHGRTKWLKALIVCVGLLSLLQISQVSYSEVRCEEGGALLPTDASTESTASLLHVERSVSSSRHNDPLTEDIRTRFDLATKHVDPEHPLFRICRFFGRDEAVDPSDGADAQDDVTPTAGTIRPWRVSVPSLRSSSSEFVVNSVQNHEIFLLNCSFRI